MPRPPKNPFYALLGIAGFALTITAAAYCVAVLRGIRPATDTGGSHALDRLVDEYGTMLLISEIALLGFATVGAIWLDHVAGEKIRRQRAAQAAAAGNAVADQP